ncbi:MAG TPA: FAD-linked oxidase C-terminal domain-containing protein [Chthoniobacterales bacterium]
MSPLSELEAALTQALGARGVKKGAAAAPYGGDKWFAHRQPDFAVLPRTAEQAAGVLKIATQFRVPVTPRGAGYGYVGGCVPEQGGIVLSTEKMNRILELNDEDFVAVVQPAVITGELQAAARMAHLFYPPDPASLKNCSIGGNIATNAGGPRCLKYGTTRHYVLGLQVALMDGTLVRLGGRTHKNKTGFDLAGLFVGSEGLLGIVTEATLRLLPLPTGRAALSAGFTDMRHAAEAVQAIFHAGFLPAAVEIADSFTLQAARAAMPNARRIPPGDAHLLVEIDGQRDSVRLEILALQKVVSRLKPTAVKIAKTPAECEKLWDLRRGFSQSLKSTGLTKLNEDIVVPRGKLVDLIAFARQLQQKSGFPIACFGHAGDGNIHVNIMVEGIDAPGVRAAADQVLDELFRQILAWGGAITGEHGIGLAKLPWWPQAANADLRRVHHAIKSALDPHQLLNPGKFGGA